MLALEQTARHIQNVCKETKESKLLQTQTPEHHIVCADGYSTSVL